MQVRDSFAYAYNLLPTKDTKVTYAVMLAMEIAQYGPYKSKKMKVGNLISLCFNLGADISTSDITMLINAGLLVEVKPGTVALASQVVHNA